MLSFREWTRFFGSILIFIAIASNSVAILADTTTTTTTAATTADLAAREAARNGLVTLAATSAATNFKSNYDGTSALKGLTAVASGSSSNYYNQKQQQQQQDEEQQLYHYYDSRELANIVNESPLTRAQQTGFAATANGFVPTAIIANTAGPNTISSNNYNRNNNQNIHINNNNNNNNNHYNFNDYYNTNDSNNNNKNVIFKQNMAKWLEIPKGEIDYKINNEDYENVDDYHINALYTISTSSNSPRSTPLPLTSSPTTSLPLKTTTANKNVQIPYYREQGLHAGRDINGLLHESDIKADPNYFTFNAWQQQQQPQTQTRSIATYLHDYENEHFNDYRLQQLQQQKQQQQQGEEEVLLPAKHEKKELRAKLLSPTTTAAGESNNIKSNSYNRVPAAPEGTIVKTNYDQTLQQPEYGITTTRREQVADAAAETNESYTQLYKSAQQPHLPPPHTIVRHNALSEAALSDIPLARHVTVTKHLPVVQYQRLHVPYNQSVPIELPQPVISTEARPLPIQVPVSKTVAVPVMQELRIPIEKLRPFPVERQIPFIVERRIPYRVERQIAVPYYYPYPIRVPVVKTVVHKLKPTHATHNKHAALSHLKHF